MRRPPNVKGSWGDRAESLRQKDRAPEGVLENSIRTWDRRRRGNTLRSPTHHAQPSTPALTLAVTAVK